MCETKCCGGTRALRRRERSRPSHRFRISRTRRTRPNRPTPCRICCNRVLMKRLFDRRNAQALRVCLCMILAAGLASCSKTPTGPSGPRGDAAVPVVVAPVETIPLDRTLSVIGTLFAKDQATVGAQVEGECEKTLVDFGDRVTAGQELALIDTTSYQALASQAAANVAKAMANAENAEQNLKRSLDLQKDKIVSAAQIDDAEAQAK